MTARTWESAGRRPGNDSKQESGGGQSYLYAAGRARTPPDISDERMTEQTELLVATNNAGKVRE
ncbi:MAG TPA: hypothetical protein VGB98_21980, partial [Pyrinomonadaceae bacterium]